MARATRVYARSRNGVTRYYLDLRSLGGRQEALVAPGDRSATTDSDIAGDLAAKRIEAFRAEMRQRSDESRELKRREVIDGLKSRWGLKAYCVHHLTHKARSGKVTEEWVENLQKNLECAANFFGDTRDVASIGVGDVQDYLAHLRTLPNGRGGTLSEGSVRHYLNALSGLYTRAQAESVVGPGYNPVAALMDKPVAPKREANWLEINAAAEYLEAARTYRPRVEDGATPWVYPIIATFLLTGGRHSEVLGLEVDDVSFKRKTVTFRPNAWRRLKTGTSHRVVPLPPQLEEILRDYLLAREREAPLGSLLFPSARLEGEVMIHDVRKALDHVSERAGWQKGEVRTKAFRHTYCAAALQLLDRGHPISPWTVARWMGHGGQSLVDQVYGHLGEVRHRSPALEYFLVSGPADTIRTTTRTTPGH